MQVFLNIVLDDAVEEKPDGKRERIGMVVIRGNSVVMLEVGVLRTRWERFVLTDNRPSREWATTADNSNIISLLTTTTRYETRINEKGNLCLGKLLVKIAMLSLC